jgi:hypothetical protein
VSGVVKFFTIEYVLSSGFLDTKYLIYNKPPPAGNINLRYSLSGAAPDGRNLVPGVQRDKKG